MPHDQTPKKPEKRKLITFEPTDEIRELLDKAEKATGTDRTTLIMEAIRSDLPKVVQRIIEQRKRAAEEFFRMSSPDNPGEVAFSSETKPPYRTASRNKPKS